MPAMKDSDAYLTERQKHLLGALANRQDDLRRARRDAAKELRRQVAAAIAVAETYRNEAAIELLATQRTEGAPAIKMATLKRALGTQNWSTAQALVDMYEAIPAEAHEDRDPQFTYDHARDTVTVHWIDTGKHRYDGAHETRPRGGGAWGTGGVRIELYVQGSPYYVPNDPINEFIRVGTSGTDPLTRRKFLADLEPLAAAVDAYGAVEYARAKQALRDEF